MNCTLVGATTLACLLALAPAPPPDVAQLAALKDNTLYQPDGGGETSSGAGPQFFAGRIGGFGGGQGLRRGLIAFDVAGAVPAGSTINSVTLSVLCSHVPILDNNNPRTHSLLRATSDWGQGASDPGLNGGQGAPPTPGDATWSDAFFPGTPWGTPGGDFSATVSSSVQVPSVGPYDFPSTAQLVADVQDMLDDPAGNFGWVMTGDEVSSGVARAFDSSESVGYPGYDGVAPVLTIDFTPPSAVPALSLPGLVLLGLLLGGGVALAARRSALS